MIVTAIGLTAFLLCLLSTPLIRDFFIRMGKVDHPDSDRKFHGRAVPRCGGVGIVLAYFVSLAFIYLLAAHFGYHPFQQHALFVAILPATLVMFLVGLADDLFNFRPRVKLAGQCAAAVLAVCLGVHITPLHGPAWLGVALSIVWLLACTNAVNLIDGMDGLATGVGLTATVPILLVALLNGNLELAMLTVPLTGALLAFLRYNFSPASIFLGDSGSLTVGFLLGCLGLVWDKRHGTLGMIGPLMTMALPLLDVGLSIGRRFLRRRPIFTGDRGHIHHRVLALGFTTRGATLILYSCCFLSASLALLQTLGQHEIGIYTFAIFAVLLLLGIKRLGYVEFQAARKILGHRKIRQAVQEEIYLEELRVELLKAHTPEECWAVLQQACKALSIKGVHLQLGTEHHVREAMMLSDAPNCHLRLVLADNKWLLLTGASPAQTRTFASMIHHVQAAFHQRLSLVRNDSVAMNKAA